jgi:hypothetical protein
LVLHGDENSGILRSRDMRTQYSMPLYGHCDFGSILAPFKIALCSMRLFIKHKDAHTLYS